MEFDFYVKCGCNWKFLSEMEDGIVWYTVYVFYNGASGSKDYS
jgi:hypothetical protein